MSYLLDELKAAFPDLWRLGFGDVLVQAVSGPNGDQSWEQIIATVRQSEQYKIVFPGMSAADGSRRFSTEAEYLKVVDTYRDVLREFGMWDASVEGPANYLPFFDNQIDPNELRDRLNVYKALQRGSRELKDAFYVFGGLTVTDDQVYDMVVSGGRHALIAEYNARTTGGALDYDTFISRVADLTTERLGELVTELTAAGVMSSTEAQAVLSSDPTRQRMLLGALWSGSGSPMNLEGLMTAFQYAMLGSAASEQGLVMPDASRLEEFRTAGVNRAQATQAFGRYAAQQNLLVGASVRAGGRTINQDLYEQAVLLGRGDAMAELSKTLQAEESYGVAGGGFSQQMEGQRVAQGGRRASGS